MMKDSDEEIEASRRRAATEQDAIEETLRQAEHASRQITATALSQLGDDTPQRASDPLEMATVNDALSSRNMEDVDKYGIEKPFWKLMLLNFPLFKPQMEPLLDQLMPPPPQQQQPSSAEHEQTRRFHRSRIPSQWIPLIRNSEASSYRSVEESETTEEQDEPTPDE
eukprot:6492318-Amphidinium_carterae.2